MTSYLTILTLSQCDCFYKVSLSVEAKHQDGMNANVKAPKVVNETVKQNANKFVFSRAKNSDNVWNVLLHLIFQYSNMSCFIKIIINNTNTDLF